MVKATLRVRKADPPEPVADVIPIRERTDDELAEKELRGRVPQDRNKDRVRPLFEVPPLEPEVDKRLWKESRSKHPVNNRGPKVHDPVPEVEVPRPMTAEEVQIKEARGNHGLTIIRETAP